MYGLYVSKITFLEYSKNCTQNNFFKPNTRTGKTCFNACTKTQPRTPHPHPHPPNNEELLNLVGLQYLE